MPETQAKSGGTGASATPDEAAKKDAAANGRDGAARAANPADAPSPPKFTRAPGMAPPPGEPTADSDGSSDGKRPGGPGVAKGSATVPIVTKGKGAAPSRPTVTPPPAAPQRPTVTGAANQPGNVTGGAMPGARVNFGGDGASAGGTARPVTSRPAGAAPSVLGSSSTGAVEEPPDFACVSVIN